LIPREVGKCCVSWWLSLSVSLSLCSYAQDRAAINGAVTDSTTALVANATIELKSANTGLHRAVLTNDGGLYEITALPVGSFTITITKYENWDFVIQQQLPRDWLFQIGYTGGEGHHLFDRATINLINPLTGKRPLAGFGSFGLKENNANNNFNALQTALHRRFTRGLLFQANYMWSHGITDASIGSGESVNFQDQSCRACDRRSSNIDVRHNLTLNGVMLTNCPSGKANGSWPKD
jgi:hypothetical protein